MGLSCSLIPETYFEIVKHRLSTHPVISAYVRPKLDFIRKTVLLDESTTVLEVECGNGI